MELAIRQMRINDNNYKGIYLKHVKIIIIIAPKIILKTVSSHLVFTKLKLTSK